MNFEQTERDKIFSQLKDKRSFQLQKRLYKLVNDKALLHKLSKKESITVHIEKEIQSITKDFSQLYHIDIQYNTKEQENIQTCLEALISKSFHNSFISFYEREDLNFLALIRKIQSQVKHTQSSIESFLVIDDSINCLSHNIKKDLGRAIFKLKNDLYFYQSAEDKLNTIKEFILFIKEIFGGSYEPEENIKLKMFIRLVSYAIVKGEIYRIYSNILFLKAFRSIALTDSETIYYLNIFELSIRKLKFNYEKITPRHHPHHHKAEVKIRKRSRSSSETKHKNKQKLSDSQTPTQNTINSVYPETDDDKPKIKDLDETDFDINNTSNISLNHIDYNPFVDNVDATLKEAQKKKINITEFVNHNQTLLTLNTDDIRKKYFSKEFTELNQGKFESMYNDFKIVLKTIESFKYELKYSMQDK